MPLTTQFKLMRRRLALQEMRDKVAWRSVGHDEWEALHPDRETYLGLQEYSAAVKRLGHNDWEWAIWDGSRKLGSRRATTKMAAEAEVVEAFLGLLEKTKEGSGNPIPKSTSYKIFRVSDGKLVFAGSLRDAQKEIKKLGLGHKMWLTTSETMPKGNPEGSNGLSDTSIEAYQARYRESLSQVSTELERMFPGKVSSRLKTVESIMEKLTRRGTELSSLTDIAGVRVVFSTLDSLYAGLKKIRGEFNVIEEEDYITQPKGLYRSYHLLVESNGLPVEVQLKTKRMLEWSEMGHAQFPVYKEQEELRRKYGKKLKKLETYYDRMAEHYYKSDTGEKLKRPKVPSAWRGAMLPLFTMNPTNMPDLSRMSPGWTLRANRWDAQGQLVIGPTGWFGPSPVASVQYVLTFKGKGSITAGDLAYLKELGLKKGKGQEWLGPVREKADMSKNPSRYANKREQAELVNLYHLARAALAGKDDSRHARMVWAAKEFAKAHSGWSSTVAYLNLEMALESPIISFIPPNAPSPHKQRGGYGHSGGTYGRRKENPMSIVSELKCPSCGQPFESGSVGVGRCSGCGAGVSIQPGPEEYTSQKELATLVTPALGDKGRVIEPPLQNPQNPEGYWHTHASRRGKVTHHGPRHYHDAKGEGLVATIGHQLTKGSKRYIGPHYHKGKRNPTFGEMDASSITDFPDAPAPESVLESTTTPGGLVHTEGTVETKPTESRAAPEAYPGALHEYIRGVRGTTGAKGGGREEEPRLYPVPRAGRRQQG